MKIYLIVNRDKKSCIEAAKNICNELLKFSCEIFTDSDTAKENNVFCDDKAIEKCEFAISVGGDGTLLHRAAILAQYDIPVVGINLGRVGFLTQLELNEIHLLKDLFEKNYTVQERMLLDISVIRKNEKIAEFTALNDGVIGKGSLSRLVDVCVYCDSKKVSDYHADGIIVCTPTGSTAYSFSAGGAVIDPSVNAIGVTPICAHCVTARPIIFNPNSVLNIEIPEQRLKEIYLTVDGLQGFELCHGDRVEFIKSKKVLKLISLKNDINFYATLNSKLGI
ncbi:MAG: NAD(+)/NADH kinase [Ruminococcaceae bacterium]|nr:NAD(+)/NADH kinase [Oscillospiraceae bacterium]